VADEDERSVDLQDGQRQGEEAAAIGLNRAAKEKYVSLGRFFLPQ